MNETETRPTDPASDRNARRARLIDPQFQHQTILRLGGISLFYLLMCVLVSVAVPMLVTFLKGTTEDALEETTFRLEMLFQVMAVPLVVTFAALWAHGVQETFRIAGPNFRFKQVMGQLRERVVPRGVRVRSDDLLQDTAEEFHQALVVLHDSIARLKETSSAALEAVRAASPSCSREQHLMAVDAVQEVNVQLEAFQLVGCAPYFGPSPSAAAHVESSGIEADDLLPQMPSGSTESHVEAGELVGR